MALESVTYIDDLVATNPESDDPKSEGDDHIRNIKAALKATFPNIAGAVTVSHTELNTVTSRGLRGGDTWTGTHQFPATTYGVTAAFGSTGTKLATVDYVNAVAINAQLPAQTGKDGCSLWSDGSVTRWDRRRVPVVVVLETTQTWSPPGDCWAKVTVQGGGASGPAGANSKPGGAGGGTAIKFVRLSASVTYTATIGAGGPASGAGVDGGTSSFSGSDISTISATGGNTTTGLGGIGTGGDINIAGGPACVGTFNADSNFPSGASYFSPGGTLPNTNGRGYGAGAGNTYGAATGFAGVSGVIIIEY